MLSSTLGPLLTMLKAVYDTFLSFLIRIWMSSTHLWKGWSLSLWIEAPHSSYWLYWLVICLEGIIHLTLIILSLILLLTIRLLCSDSPSASALTKLVWSHKGLEDFLPWLKGSHFCFMSTHFSFSPLLIYLMIFHLYPSRFIFLSEVYGLI